MRDHEGLLPSPLLQVKRVIEGVGEAFETAAKTRYVALLDRALTAVVSAAPGPGLAAAVQQFREIADAEAPSQTHLDADRSARVYALRSRVAESARAWASGLSLIMSDDPDALQSSEMASFYDAVLMTNEVILPLNEVLTVPVDAWPAAVLQTRVLLQLACSHALAGCPWGIFASAARLQNEGAGDLAKAFETTAAQLDDTEEWPPASVARLDVLSRAASTTRRFRPGFQPRWGPATPDPAQPTVAVQHSGDHVILAVKLFWFAKEWRMAQAVVEKAVIAETENVAPGSALYPPGWQDVDAGAELDPAVAKRRQEPENDADDAGDDDARNLLKEKEGEEGGGRGGGSTMRRMRIL